MRRARDDGIGLDELAQATRNHGMPLEALRADVTPAGMHYVLVHYDVPFIDPATHTVAFDGFDRPLELSLDDLRARPAVTMPVTFECAGNGRALFDTRPVSQPWLLEAVGTGEWTGTPLAPLLRGGRRARRRGRGRCSPASTAGVEGGEEQALRARACRSPRRCATTCCSCYEMNGQPLLPQHGRPLRLLVPGWYGMTNVKWLARIAALDRAVRRATRTPWATACARPTTRKARPVTRIRVRSLMVPPGIPSFPERERDARRGPGHARGTGLVGLGPDRAGRGERRRLRDVGRGPARALAVALTRGTAGPSSGRRPRAST